MIASNVAFPTSALSPISLASALARSASMPSIVLPSSPMDSIGGELASDATGSLPLLFNFARTLPATADLGGAGRRAGRGLGARRRLALVVAARAACGQRDQAERQDRAGDGRPRCCPQHPLLLSGSSFLCDTLRPAAGSAGRARLGLAPVR